MHMDHKFSEIDHVTPLFEFFLVVHLQTHSELAVICIYTYNFILKMGIQTYCIAGHSVLYINVLYATGTFNARCNGYCTFLCFCIAVTYLKYIHTSCLGKIRLKISHFWSISLKMRIFSDF